MKVTVTYLNVGACFKNQSMLHKLLSNKQQLMPSIVKQNISF